MIEIKKTDDGYTYAEVTRGGTPYIVATWSTKLTLYNDFGIVSAGPPFSYKLPNNDVYDGRTLDGYTDDPEFVEAFKQVRAIMDPPLPTP